MWKAVEALQLGDEFSVSRDSTKYKITGKLLGQSRVLLLVLRGDKEFGQTYTHGAEVWVEDPPVLNIRIPSATYASASELQLTYALANEIDGDIRVAIYGPDGRDGMRTKTVHVKVDALLLALKQLGVVIDYVRP